MIEQNAVAGVDAISFTVVHRDPVGIQLGAGVRGSGVKRGFFSLGDFLDQAIQLGCRGLVKAGFFFQSQQAYAFEQAQGT